MGNNLFVGKRTFFVYVYCYFVYNTLAPRSQTAWSECVMF